MLHPAATTLPPGLGVRVSGARLAFGGVPVFAGLTADFAAGSFTCILGASGVGKSSLLRLMAGLVPEAEPGAATGSDGGSLAGRIAYMDQRDLLMPWLSALENVLLGARLRGQPRDTARAQALLAAVGLGSSQSLHPAQLSGGMRQRVALARTLMEDRPVVLMDEPFSAVDALTRLRLQDLAVGLLAGRTVVMVTHDPLEALRIADVIHVMTGSPAVLDDGRGTEGTEVSRLQAPPREPTDPAVVALHRDLLARLGVGEA